MLTARPQGHEHLGDNRALGHELTVELDDNQALGHKLTLELD